MAKTKFAVYLKGDQINGSKVSCEGEQIALVMETLVGAIGECVWFVSDICEQIDGPRRFPEEIPIPSLIGSFHQTVNFLRQVSQFVWGVFLAVPVDRLPVGWPEIYSEMETFRNIGEAIVEIRAFDGSFLEVNAIDLATLRPIIDRFGGQIRTPEDRSSRT